MNGSCNVLHLVRAQVFEVQRELFLDRVVNAAGDPNLSRRGQGLQPGSDVYAIAIQIAPLDDYIAKIDPDAEHDPPVFRLDSAGLGHFFLQLNGTGDGIDRARELDQHAITHHLDDPAMVLGDERRQDFAPALLRVARVPASSCSMRRA